jgi:sporulation protein YlmC with PRC-barrel domain
VPITFTNDLKGRTVLDDGGNVVGALDEVFIDPASWQVEAVRVKLDRGASEEMGARSGMFHSVTANIPCAMVRAAGDAVILSVSRAAVQELVKGAGDSEPAHGQTADASAP